MTDDVERLASQARVIRDIHDPTQQPDNKTARCALCHFQRHPCDAFDMAWSVLVLLGKAR